MSGRCRFLFALVVLLGGVLPAAAEPLDVVVMVDVSQSMFPVFDDLKQYLLRDLPEKRLRPGDSFHLLSFADAPESELSVDIQSAEDLRPAIGRILLLQPLGHYTDLIAALDFLYSYTEALPGGEDKLVLLCTDGIHDPPPGSPNRLEGAAAVSALLERTEKIRRAGWNVHILQMPLGAEGTAGGPPGAGAPAGGEAAATPGPSGTGQDLLQSLREQLQAPTTVYSEVEKEDISGRLTGFSTLHFPAEPLGRVARRFTLPMRVSNFASESRRYQLSAVLLGDEDLLRRPVAVEVPQNQSRALPVPLRLPPRRVVPAGEHDLLLEFRFADPQLRISPLSGVISIERRAALPWLPPIALPYLLYALGALVLLAAVLLLLLFVRRRLQDAAFARFFEGLAERRGARPIILKVDEQNPNIGARNIHRLPPGASLSVGGDGSAFVIFYVPVPRRIALIRNEKGHYVFVPKRMEHFVDLEGPLPDCLGKPIRALSTRGHTVTLRFHEYVSPLEELNRLMRSIRQPGAPGSPAEGEAKPK